MPVTAKLSKLFYERFGEQVTNELVDWFNQVDQTYRNELRDLNETYYARFEAKLEQRLAEVKAELKVEIAQIRADLERGFRTQTAWFFVAWATMFVTLVALELRR
jgi:hypothetical protein